MNNNIRQNSYWMTDAPETSFPQLAGDMEADVAIIGGGIVGVTAARLLKNEGLRVALCEARKVGREVTGKSTAKITSQHNISYQTLQRKFGSDGARIYADANEAGLRAIRDLAARCHIDCDLETKSAYTFTRDQRHVAEIEREVELARSLGLPASLARETSLPFDILAAIRFDNQAQFHPCKYVAGLALTIPGDGCHIFEQSRVVDWNTDRIVTAQGSVRARHVIMATHMPLGQVGSFYAEAYPHAHPVIAGRVDPARAPEGMFINIEQPRISVRTHQSGDRGMFLILAGTSFKPGHPDEERTHFEELERFGADWFGIQAEYRWVNEDYTPMDGAPFIGRSSSHGDAYLVATGFNAWGITNGTVAAMILTDMIAGRDNEWLRLFDATRVKPIAGGKEFIRGNLEVAGQLVGGYLSRKRHSPDQLAPGEAAIVKVEGENVAAFRDDDGRLHMVAAACTHMGCILGWNETDRTWDCPCHGSRFDLRGEVIHGPAVKALEKKGA
jgi:glycine/D-amino acid oxidase-like deaminating enzyme/nitrite reductase/ring-hydroxylating ferredoxin subunit